MLRLFSSCGAGWHRRSGAAYTAGWSRGLYPGCFGALCTPQCAGRIAQALTGRFCKCCSTAGSTCDHGCALWTQMFITSFI